MDIAHSLLADHDIVFRGLPVEAEFFQQMLAQFRWELAGTIRLERGPKRVLSRCRCLSKSLFQFSNALHQAGLITLRDGDKLSLSKPGLTGRIRLVQNLCR